MIFYKYARNKVGSQWNIDNPKDVDAQGFSVVLGKRVQDAFPGRECCVTLDDLEAAVGFETELTTAEKTTLDGVVAAHEAANGTENMSTYVELISPDGTVYKVLVDNNGNLFTEEL